MYAPDLGTMEAKDIGALALEETLVEGRGELDVAVIIWASEATGRARRKYSISGLAIVEDGANFGIRPCCALLCCIFVCCTVELEETRITRLKKYLPPNKAMWVQNSILCFSEGGTPVNWEAGMHAWFGTMKTGLWPRTTIPLVRIISWRRWLRGSG